MDVALLGLLLLSFATLLTAHVVICARLVFTEERRWRGVVALLVAPLAPWWARQEAWSVLTWVWIVALMAYGLARVAVSF